ncbi:MAG: protoporphyrinogen oxidase, partial [Verrucomicrobiales bacterium]|nr:protoporphyrinogen oxidase [Verrucomicrobiales bacterium]
KPAVQPNHLAATRPAPRAMNTVAILGAGITGLVAAYRLQRLGVAATVYEAADRPGGVVQTHLQDGYLAEAGPNTLLETSPRIRQLLLDLELEEELVGSNPNATKRYLVREGHPSPLPDSLPGWLRTDLFSLTAKLRVLGDLLQPRYAPDGEEDLAHFVVRRLGREFLDRAINPFVAGVYAGDPQHLSVREAFPRLHAVEQKYGSLLLGQVLGARERKRRGETPRANAPKLSFLRGLGTLGRALHDNLGYSVLLRTTVTGIRRTADSWYVTSTRDGKTTTHSHRAVLLAAPAHKLAHLAWETPDHSSLTWLDDIEYAPVTALVLGFRRDDVEHPLDGFGVLVPEVEKLPILGAIFNSSLFPNRAPEGHVTLTCYLGGTRDPKLALAPFDDQLQSTLAALRSLLGVRGAPTFIHHTVHTRGIPQYNVGFGQFRDRMRALEDANPGLLLAGHFRNGISLSDCVIAGDDAGWKLAGVERPDFHASAP